MSASSHGRAWRDRLRAGQEKVSDRFFQFREGDRFGRCARLENDVPPRPQLGPVLANGFAQPPLEPVPFDGPAHRARDGQSDPARALPIDPGEPHKKSQVAAASLGVHFAIVGGAQQARTLRKPVLSLGSPHRELPCRSPLLGGNSQALAPLPAAAGQNLAPPRCTHPRPKPVGLGPLPFPWLIRPLRHVASSENSRAKSPNSHHMIAGRGLSRRSTRYRSALTQS